MRKNTIDLDEPMPIEWLEHAAAKGVGGSGAGDWIRGNIQRMAREILRLRKQTVKDIQKACEHKWIGVGPEGLGGYSAYECSICKQEAGVGGVLRS